MYDSMKGSFPQASETQFLDKIRRLKYKFFKPKSKRGKRFLTPQEAELHQLMVKVWGKDGLASFAAKPPSVSRRVLKRKGKEVVRDDSALTLSIRFGDGPALSVVEEEEAVRHCLASMDDSTKNQLNKKWEMSLRAENDLWVYRLGLLREVLSAGSRLGS